MVLFFFQELKGPKDRHEAKYSIVAKLLEPITARYVRFIPTTAPALKVMRAELYGCMAEPLPPYGGRSRDLVFSLENDRHCYDPVIIRIIPKIMFIVLINNTRHYRRPTSSLLPPSLPLPPSTSIASRHHLHH